MNISTFYLVYLLIEQDEAVIDAHYPYYKREDALKRFNEERKECAKRFSICVMTEQETFYEFYDEDGHGFTIGIEEMELQ